ncbi:MAG: glycosyltransferase family 4 protein [Proteobacteria bacterium]|nr:glycosyltransferase family 4 protein [Pseudomonadota bacterium]
MINYEFPPIGGGGGNANFYILREFAEKRDVRVNLVTSSETKSTYIHQFSENITVHRLNVRKKRLHYWTELEVLAFLYKSSSYVHNLMKKESFDLCHSFFGFPSGYIAYRGRKQMPYIVSLRGSDVPGFNPRFSLQYLFLSPLFKKIWTEAKAVIVNSRELQNLAYKTAPLLPIDVIYNGIDIDEFKPDEKKQKKHPTILTVTRLISRKCIDFLLKAMPSIISHIPDIKLIIAGEGNMENDLRRLADDLGIGNQVEFRGYVKHELLPALYREADVFVLPSLWEGMSNTVLEAMASGLPVIVTETGGTAELVRDNGIIIPKQNSNAISETIITLFAKPDKLKEMGARSRTIAMDFSWAKVAGKYMEIYEESIKWR